MSSSSHMKANALAAGPMLSGLWRSFMVDNPAPHVATKAARQQVHCIKDQLVDSDTGGSDDEDGN